MMKTTRILLPAVLMSLSLAPAAVGEVIFTSNNSQIQASAFAGVGSPFSFDLDNPAPLSFSDTAIPANYGGTLPANASATDSNGDSTADFSSTIAVDVSQAGPVVTVEMDLNYTTSQSASPGTSADDFDRANAEGSTVIELIFDLDQDYTYTFNAPGVSAAGTPELEFRLDVIPGGDSFDASLQDQNGDVVFNGFLPAGSGYKLVINIDDSDNLGSADGASASALAGFEDAKFVLTPVPEPTSLALLGLGGLLIARRRRG